MSNYSRIAIVGAMVMAAGITAHASIAVAAGRQDKPAKPVKAAQMEYKATHQTARAEFKQEMVAAKQLTDKKERKTARKAAQAKYKTARATARQKMKLAKKALKPTPSPTVSAEPSVEPTP